MALRPDRIIQVLEGFRGSAILSAAIELDLFTALPGTAASVARARRASERGVRIALDALAALELIRKAGRRYDHTALSRTFLSRRSRAYIGDVAKLFVHPVLWNAYLGMPSAIRKGGTALPRNAHSANQKFWVDFARVTATQSLFSAETLAGLVKARPGMRVLDVACGSGVYGLAMARRGAEVTLCDQAYVLRETRRIARSWRLSPRYLPGDIFAVPWGGPYDVVVLSHVLHHFDRAGCEGLLDRAYRALAPGGTLALQEFVPDDERRRRLRPLLFATIMLLWTKGGDAYTWGELRAMIEAAGFRGARIGGWREPRQVILARRPR